jgi:hypothetical protein
MRGNHQGLGQNNVKMLRTMVSFLRHECIKISFLMRNSEQLKFLVHARDFQFFLLVTHDHETSPFDDRLLCTLWNDVVFLSHFPPARCVLRHKSAIAIPNSECGLLVESWNNFKSLHNHLAAARSNKITRQFSIVTHISLSQKANIVHLSLSTHLAARAPKPLECASEPEIAHCS